jgi:pathogen-inducible salicylic acid glucosyltransferase
VTNWIASKWSILTVGPTAPSMLLGKQQKNSNEDGNYLFETNTEVCLKWLDERETVSVIYVSFGSMASLREEQMEEVAQGLLRSNCHFLWVVRADQESKLPKDFKSETSEKGLIINWCPQLDVLAHRAVACFMTHCGWNSTLEALCSGVPMIAVPQWVDQTTNAKFIADVWEAGVRVQVNENRMVTGEEIERCIRQVTETERGKELKRNAIKWKELAKEAVSEGGSSDRNIEEFASGLLLC